MSVTTNSIISIDAMSGDLGAEVAVRAAYLALNEHANIEFLLVGDESELRRHVTRIVGDDPRLSIVHASQVVEMSDSPIDAMRKKKDSSMRVAIDLVTGRLSLPNCPPRAARCICSTLAPTRCVRRITCFSLP